jgi:hypothetical protein
MNSFSHILLGKILLKHLEEHHGVELDRRAFLHGCIMPDFRRSYKSRPHELSRWTHYLKSEIGSLAGLKQVGRRFDSSFSRRLGVICHFYSDFFCFAHTGAFEGGSYAHLKYEWALDRRLRENTAKLYRAEFGVKTLPVLNAETIYGDFESLLAAYSSCEADHMRDVSFALRACAGTVTAIADSAEVTAAGPARLVGLVARAANG